MRFALFCLIALLACSHNPSHQVASGRISQTRTGIQREASHLEPTRRHSEVKFDARKRRHLVLDGLRALRENNPKALAPVADALLLEMPDDARPYFLKAVSELDGDNDTLNCRQQLPYFKAAIVRWERVPQLPPLERGWLSLARESITECTR